MRGRLLGLVAVLAIVCCGTRLTGAATAVALRDRRTPIVEAAERISPSVVSINATLVRAVSRIDPFFEDFFSPFFPRRYFSEQEIPSIGSGLIVSADGYILTNYHVVEGASRIQVTLSSGAEYEARFLDADRIVDIAVLKVEAEDLIPAVFGATHDLMIGETTLAVGNPFGAFESDPHPSVSVGVVSAVNRFFRADTFQGETPRIYQNMIQTDAAINPGNSGGPLVNIRGEAIGINTFIYSRSGGSHGIGFAIPIERARAVYDEVRQHGRVRALLLDMEIWTLTPGLRQRLSLPENLRGALLASLSVADGPAAAADLQPGDVIVRMDQKPIRSRDDFYEYFATLQVGTTIEIELVRGGRSITKAYRVAEGGTRDTARD